MYIGMKIEEIETPALIIDFDRFNNNMKKMQEHVESKGCSLRPHFKTHKSPLIAHMQVEKGAVGITCAKLGEAEVLARSGIKSILIANQIVDTSKIKRLAGLSKYCEIIVAVDNLKNLDDLNDAAVAFNTTISILIELDIGMGRCGVRSEIEALQLASKIGDLSRLRLKGIMGYEGHCVFIKDGKERELKTNEALGKLVHLKDHLINSGFPIEIVSGGGTGTHKYFSSFIGVTELQAGSYIFMDDKYNSIEDVDYENSLFLLSTVISKPQKGLAIIDAGMKSITMEFGLPMVISRQEMVLDKLSEEHGIIKIDLAHDDLNIGDKVFLMPSHGCTTINLHDKYFVSSKGLLTDIWEISGRGKYV